MPKKTPVSPSKAAAVKATKRWENKLGGLSAILHQIDKRFTTYRSRARKTVKESSDWNQISKQEQDRRLADAVNAVNREQQEKREEAEMDWVDRYGDQEGSSEDTDESEEKHEWEEDDSEEEDSDSEEDDSEEDMDIEEWHGIQDNDDDVQDNDDDMDEEETDQGDEVEESDTEDPGVFDPATYDDDLGKRLNDLRAQQSSAMWRMLESFEKHGKARQGQEVPDDYAFGEYEDSEE